VPGGVSKEKPIVGRTLEVLKDALDNYQVRLSKIRDGNMEFPVRV
jgi:hypothetical protein